VIFAIAPTSWTRAVETAAAMEIEKVAFGDFYVMISTAAWKSLRKTTLAFPQFPQRSLPYPF